ncbi:MAG: MFS transporter [Rickettsiales bacterium]|nr:MFS transporter [Rickettsiales bacterium]
MFTKTNRESFWFLVKYYCLNFFRGLVFLSAFIPVLIDDNLTPMQVSMIMSVYSMSTMFLTVPVSYFSGKVGCKKTAIFGIGSFIVGYICLLLYKNIFSFIAYNFFHAIYSCVFNSAVETLTYGNIRHLGLKGFFARVKSISGLFRSVAIILSALIGGKLFYSSNVDIIIVCDIVILSSIVFILLLTEDRKTEGSLKLGKNYKKLVRDSFKYLYKHRVLGRFLIFQSFWNAIEVFIYIYRTLYCEQISTGNFEIGNMLALQTMVGTISHLLFIKYFIKKNLDVKSGLYVIAAACLMVSTIHYYGALSYIFFTLFLVLIHIGYILTHSELVSLIPERLMPTILLAYGLISEFIKSVLLYIFGYVANNTNYKTAFVTIACVTTIINTGAYLLLKYDKHLIKAKLREKKII